MKGTLAGGYTELMMACEDGDLEAVRALATSEALAARNQAGYTALGLAIKAGQGEVVRELLSKGAEVNARNNAGQSMLFLACWRKHKPMVKALLAAGAQVDEADQRGWTPLMIAVYNDLRDIVDVLLTYKPNLDAKDCVSSHSVREKGHRPRQIDRNPQSPARSSGPLAVRLATHHSQRAQRLRLHHSLPQFAAVEEDEGQRLGGKPAGGDCEAAGWE